MMNGIKIKKTSPSDFEKIYPLLMDFHSSYSKEDWKKIFTYQWKGAEDYVGFHLEKQNEVVGFMGLIFSSRNKDNQQYKICNITSLIVKKEYRAATIFFLRKLKNIENTIFTGLRPINESYQLLTNMGFKAFENEYKILPTLLNFLGTKQKMVVYDDATLLTKTNVENTRIAQDHQKLNCSMVLFESDNKQCLLIFRASHPHKIQVLHISDIDFFNKNIANVLHFFNRQYGFFSMLYVDQRYLLKNRWMSVSRPIHPPRICYNPNSHPIIIDELYSEAVLL